MTTQNNQPSAQTQGAEPVATNPTPSMEAPAATAVSAPDNQGNPSTANAGASTPEQGKQLETATAVDGLLTETVDSGADGNPAAEGETSEAQGAPEKYELPTIEGLESFTPDTPAVSKFLEVAKELNLSNEAAQKLFAKVAPELTFKPEAVRTRLTNEGIAATKADPDLGGANFDTTVALAKTAYNDSRFVTPALRKLLGDTGLNSHPEIVRLFRNIGKLTGEGSFPKGDGGDKPLNFQELYPKSKLNP